MEVIGQNKIKKYWTKIYYGLIRMRLTFYDIIIKILKINVTFD